MRWFLFFAAVGLAYGQLDSNTITVTASRAANLAPDQAIIGVLVYSNIDTGLDLITALPGAGLSAANLSGVNTFNQGLQWSFQVMVPLSKIADTFTALSAAQNSSTAIQNNLALSYGLQGTRFSQELQAAHPCALPTLLADAQAQAQRVAAAAGMSVGAVINMSDGKGSTAATAPTGVYVLGVISVISPGQPTGNFYPPPVSPTLPPCTLVVQFQLR